MACGITLFVTSQLFESCPATPLRFSTRACGDFERASPTSSDHDSWRAARISKWRLALASEFALNQRNGTQRPVAPASNRPTGGPCLLATRAIQHATDTDNLRHESWSHHLPVQNPFTNHSLYLLGSKSLNQSDLLIPVWFGGKRESTVYELLIAFG
jgi:hypothetical protein